MVNCVATLGVVVFSYAGLADTNRSDTHQVHQHQQPHVPTPATHPNGSPNVLLLLVDDLRPMLPFYGTDRMKAPNLAKLAASGLQFNNSYVQQAICSPTRNSFMTGRAPDHTRLWNFQGSFRSNGVDKTGKAGADWKTMPQAFKEAGWITAGCGKTFHPGVCCTLQT